MQFETLKFETLKNELIHNVPRFIEHIKKRGLKEQEISWLKSPEVEEILNFSDKYILYPKDKKTFEEGLFVLVKAIAILSFCPYGVTIFGIRFDSNLNNYYEEID